MRAKINTTSGTAIDLEGTEAELAQVIAILGGGQPQPVKRGPGRPPKNASTGTDVGNGKTTRRGKPPSPARRKAMQLQGQYLGTIRQLKAVDKAKVKAVARENGVAAGLAMAKKLAGEK